MPIVILIPMLICIVAVFRDSVQKAFLNVYLPVFLLVPIYYFWKVALLPPVDFSEAVLLPLGIAIAFKELRAWRFSASDLALLFFVFSSFYADSLTQPATVSVFDLFGVLCTAVVPYMAGKLLIEPYGARTATARRIVILMFVSCIISVYEYRMGQNPFSLLFSRFFPDEHFAWKTQIRWGFGRVSGPFGQSELAGMMFFFGLVLTLWLGYFHLWAPRFKGLRWLPVRKSTAIACVIGVVLLMTQARGPWIGALIALPIALIGRSRRVVRTALIVFTLCAVWGTVAYIGLQRYSAGNQPGSAEQETAQYRAQLLTNYVPIAERGGAFGWGQDFPRALGQGSIDNEYLFLALTQGWVGLLAFCILALSAVYHLAVAAFTFTRQRDRYFAFSLLGITVGLLVTICTVFLGNQPYQLFFLLAGWAQAVRPRVEALPQPHFQQVFT